MNPEPEPIDNRLSAVLTKSSHYLELDNPAMAEQELRRGLSEFPDEGILYCNLAIALAAQERYGEAEEEALTAIRIDPEEASHHGVLGSICMDCGKHIESEKCLLEGLRLDPVSDGLYRMYAQLMFKTGHLDKAEKLVRKALELAPDESQSHGLLALIMSEKSKREQAEAAGRRSLSIDPDETFSHYSTGMAYYESGRPFRARRHFREALRLQPSANIEEAYLAADKATRWIYLPMYYWTLAISKLPGRQFLVWFMVIVCFYFLRSAGLETVAHLMLIAYLILVIYTWTAEPLARLWIRMKPPQ